MVSIGTLAVQAEKSQECRVSFVLDETNLCFDWNQHSSKAGSFLEATTCPALTSQLCLAMKGIYVHLPYHITCPAFSPPTNETKQGWTLDHSSLGTRCRLQTKLSLILPADMDPSDPMIRPITDQRDVWIQTIDWTKGSCKGLLKAKHYVRIVLLGFVCFAICMFFATFSVSLDDLYKFYHFNSWGEHLLRHCVNLEPLLSFSNSDQRT